MFQKTEKMHNLDPQEQAYRPSPISPSASSGPTLLVSIRPQCSAVVHSDCVHLCAPCVPVAVEVARSALSVFICKNASAYIETPVGRLVPCVSCVADSAARTIGEKAGRQGTGMTAPYGQEGTFGRQIYKQHRFKVGQSTTVNRNSHIWLISGARIVRGGMN